MYVQRQLDKRDEVTAVRRNSQAGFTLVEMMVTLVLMAIMVGLAVPGFGILIKNNRIETQTSAMYSALMLARSEGLKRVSRITVCRSSNGTSCATSGGWEQGWIVFDDCNNNAVVNTGTCDGGANEEILRWDQPLTGGNTLRGTTDVASYISYVGNGYTVTTSNTFQSGTLVLCDDRGFTSNASAIIISATGRPRIVEATSSSLITCTP